MYVGRTNEPARRQAEHERDDSKKHLKPLEVKFTGLTKNEARFMEQILISAYSVDKLDNARREIAAGKVANAKGQMNDIICLFEGVAESELLCLMER